MSPRKVPLPLRIEPELLARVDAARGDVSRTRWVERALESALEGKVPSAGVLHGDLQHGASKPRRGESPPSPPVSSRAPVEKPPIDMGDEPEAPIKFKPGLRAPSRLAFKCPIARCEFTAKSAAAKCGAHGRTVVPV